MSYVGRVLKVVSPGYGRRAVRGAIGNEAQVPHCPTLRGEDRPGSGDRGSGFSVLPLPVALTRATLVGGI